MEDPDHLATGEPALGGYMMLYSTIGKTRIIFAIDEPALVGYMTIYA